MLYSPPQLKQISHGIKSNTHYFPWGKGQENLQHVTEMTVYNEKPNVLMFKLHFIFAPEVSNFQD